MNRPIRVLFIEDNPGDARLVQEDLHSMGSSVTIRVEWVDRLAEGLRWLALNRPQAILLDLNLPDSQGLETLERVLVSAPSLPVIVMTGQADEELGTRAVQAGAQDYLVKGQVDGNLLARSIQYAIQRKQAELQLSDALEFTEHVVTSSPMGIFTYRLSGECLSVNTAAARMVGTTVEKLSSQNFHQIESWKRSGLYAMAMHAITSRSLVADDVHVLTTFGRDAWYRAQFVTFKSGEEEHLLMIFEDITERKNADSSLREKEWLLSEAQRIGHIGSWSYEISGDSIKFSDEMYRLLDVNPDEFSHDGQGLLALVYPSDRSAVTRWMQDVRQGLPVKAISFRVIHHSGELRYIQCMGGARFDEAGRVKHFIGTMQDITERRHAELQIEQHIRQLTALSEIDHSIISSSDQRPTLDVILKQTLAQLQLDAAAVLLVSSDEGSLSFAAGRGFRTQDMEAVYLHRGEGYAGQVARERHLVRVMDLSEKVGNSAFDDFVKAEGFVSYIGVPLIVKGKVRGVLELYHKTLLHPYPDWLDFLYTLAGQTAIAIDNANMFEILQRSNRELSQAYDATIEGWSRAMDLRDRETEGHTQRVTQLTLELARRMGVDDARLVHIRRGALLHDIGKLGVPDDILFKTEGLTPEEWEVMKRHPELAYEMLASISYLKPALAIPYYHHECWDGSGYPIGLKGEQIPLEARIFAVVDVWDALRSDRKYRKAWDLERVVDYLTGQAGTQFDPGVVDCFLKLVMQAPSRE